MIEKPYKGKQTETEDLEAEVQELIKSRMEASQDPEELEIKKAVESDTLSEEEKVYAKRYGDLRRHLQKVQDEAKAREEDYQKALKEAQKNTELVLPSSKEELNSWREEHPEIAKIVESIALEKAKHESESATETLRKKIEELENKNIELAKKDSIAKVKSKHPDFDELSQDINFHNWVEEQKDNGLEWVAHAVYNSNNANEAIQAITLYKAEKGLLTPKEVKDTSRENKQKEKEAAKEVSKNSANDVPESVNNKKIWTESEIKKLNEEDFLKNIDELRRARSEGRIRAA